MEYDDRDMFREAVKELDLSESGSTAASDLVFKTLKKHLRIRFPEDSHMALVRDMYAWS